MELKKERERRGRGGGRERTLLFLETILMVKILKGISIDLKEIEKHTEAIHNTKTMYVYETTSLTLKHTLFSVGLASLSWEVTTSLKGPKKQEKKNVVNRNCQINALLIYTFFIHD